MIAGLKERYLFARHSVTHRFSLSFQQRWQVRLLRRLLAHALQNVPLWNTLYAGRNLSGDCIRTLSDVARLPVTNKEMYLGKPVEEYINNASYAKAQWFLTSGTSGKPFTFLMNDKARVQKYSDFASFRFLWWRGNAIASIPYTKIARIKIRGTSSQYRMFIPVEDVFIRPKAVFERLAAFRPEVLCAYPSVLLELVRLMKEDASLPRFFPRFILSFGESLEPSVRQYIHENLGGELYDRYGLEEIGAVGVECTQHDGFHINTESVIIEILNDDNVPVGPGEIGRVVATDLLNFNMPFIRYDTGDRGRMTFDACPCGLRSPRIWIEGRYSAFLDFPHRRIHHLEFDGAMDGFMNYVFQYQVAKLSDTDVRIRVIPGLSWNQTAEDKIIEQLKTLLGPSVQARVEIVSEISRARSGKCRIVVDESGLDN